MKRKQINFGEVCFIQTKKLPFQSLFFFLIFIVFFFLLVLSVKFLVYSHSKLLNWWPIATHDFSDFEFIFLPVFSAQPWFWWNFRQTNLPSYNAIINIEIQLYTQMFLLVIQKAKMRDNPTPLLSGCQYIFQGQGGG